ncbi:hypothetical protein A2906_00670 [Candidatus Nomurabacteria bacterium RIFCSPLOWO2_01_FULL_37_25]|nr:MAG: hypothetical protein A2640_01140 [Candidatus Nomurabacteria bacterium RIFCSPHIGHO2_01_FULL_36_23]OGI88641.1 MAG: hypothetical protein A2906_00670 [Candidatus Nomurabacteria bacterium RIFCSPLOWO2_01_FULL_37_25]
MKETFRRILIVVDIIISIGLLIIPIFVVFNRGNSEGFFEMLFLSLLSVSIIYVFYSTIVWIIQPTLKRFNIQFVQLFFKFLRRD